eukprot:CAMPEP_0201888640 /NCGR_PEP_ID=MMETSP0902-20130614/28095_1 /ASSEMBLY_ACC=CAM_ASM_000551 /TAXON_ID=420261 /ORGANISM="Thalassiosira antarctica, Strain CCMP982" /LENGTH=261 /DNA_ID=CAMNT_0048418951 /DNA_START=61 /DNA_END=846 /DNA_ORIENTATION=+
MTDEAVLKEPLLVADAQAARTVSVEAPSNLDEGYTFEAVHEGNTFLVTVPEGGVTKGQPMVVPFPNDAAGGTGFTVPTGRWRDGLCDCFRHGCFEATCCLSFWCSGMALGQVMQRMKHTWYAAPTTNAEKWKKTFMIVAAVWWIAIIWERITNMVGYDWVDQCDSNGCRKVPIINQSPALSIMRTVAMLFSIYFLYIGIKTRINMREKFNIEGSCFGDCCAVFWCSCCSFLQMSRHTHDHKEYDSVCCSKTGLRDDAPEIV